MKRIFEWVKAKLNIRSVVRCCFADLQKRYDLFIYKLSYYPILRMCERNPGIAYLMELTIKGWLEANPISPEIKNKTEEYYNEIRRQNNVN